MSEIVAPAHHPGQPQQPGARTGLAIASMVLGIVALLGCLVPVVNILSIVLGLVGLGLGVPALVLAARGRRGGRGMALTGVILSALAIVGAVVVNVLFGAALGGISGAVQEAARESEDGYAEVAPDDAATRPAEALALGTPAEVGEYTVAVTGVTQDADEVIAAENELNEPPTGQYVLVDLTVTYTGTEDGDAWIDLAPTYQGTDARDYATTSCSAVVPNAALEQPTLRNGGTASYSVCFDLPPEAIAGGRVAVGQLIDVSGEPAAWEVP